MNLFIDYLARSSFCIETYIFEKTGHGLSESNCFNHIHLICHSIKQIFSLVLNSRDFSAASTTKEMIPTLPVRFQDPGTCLSEFLCRDRDPQTPLRLTCVSA